MSISRYLLYGFAVFAIYWAYRVVYMAVRLWNLTLTPIHFETVESLPTDIAPLFESPTQVLAQAGFEVRRAMLVHNISGQWQWELLLENQVERTFATLSLNGQRPDLFDVTYYSILERGQWLMTVNGDSSVIIGKLPNTILEDGYVVGLESHLKVHLDKLESLSAATHALELSADEFFNLLNPYYASYLDSLVAAGQVTWNPSHTQLHLTPRAIVPALWQLWRAEGKVRALRKATIAYIQQPENAPPPLPVSFLADIVRSLSNHPQRQMSLRAKIGLAIATLILLVFSFTFLFEFEVILILIAIIVFHEFGHFFAMLLSGYQNITYFFLPFLGAAVSGQKRDASLAQQMFVLFAGPVPGILIGSVLLYLYAESGYPAYIRVWGLWLLIFNYINLLPLYPLDGGRIISQLIMTDRPYVMVVFMLSATGIFLLIGLWLGDLISLVLAILIGTSLPGNFRLAQRLHSLKRVLLPARPDSEQAEVITILEAMPQAGLAAAPFATKNLLIQTIRNSWAMPRAQAAIYAAFLLLYVGILSWGFWIWWQLVR